MNMNDNWDIPADILDEAEKSGQRGAYHLNTPENARASQKNPRKKFWNEDGRIMLAQKVTRVGKSGRPHTVYTVKLEIGAGSGYNIGSKLFARMAICKPAIDARDTSNGEYIMSINSIRSLKQFLDALGIDAKTETGALDHSVLAQVFTETGLDSPVVGQSLAFTVSQEEPAEAGGRYNIDASDFVEIN